MREDHPPHRANGDEDSQPHHALNFTKGLPHDPASGLITNDKSFLQFRDAVESGEPSAFAELPFGPPGGQFLTVDNANGRLRGLESPAAGLLFDLQGPDAQAVTMPPAPAVGSAELTGEMAEVYGQALLRDLPLTELSHNGGDDPLVDIVLAALAELPWFRNDPIEGLAADAEIRRRTKISRATAFRGLAAGDNIGPYLSQFLLVGSRGLGENRTQADGLIQFGSQTTNQRVQQAAPVDFMTRWDEWLDVQNGLDLRRSESYLPNQRFITTGRDLSTFVHYDALYQAYLNACLILLDRGVDFDPGLPFQEPDIIDRQEGFAHFGPAQILTQVPEIATRALKAVRYQKFNVHRRLRPEALSGRLTKVNLIDSPELSKMCDAIDNNPIGSMVRRATFEASGTETLLLPMAFAEGSPMHPSYGAGHATVAGACVTILKAFFDHTAPFGTNQGLDSSAMAYVPSADGTALEEVPVVDAHGQPAALTVEGELNKLAANISIGRDWAGVHYYSDYWESLLMGERIAVQFLREQKLTFNEEFTMTVPLFGGGTTVI